MKKLIMLIAIMLVSLIAFSQIGIKPITTDSFITIPKNVGKEIVKDIIRKDSCESELKLYVSNYNILTKNVSLKDSIILSKEMSINLFKEREKNFNSIFELKDLQKTNLETTIKTLQTDLKKTKRKLITRTIFSATLVTLITYLAIK